MKYHCPKCQSTNLHVRIESWATLLQEQDDLGVALATDIDENWDQEWGENSPMECECGHCAISLAFDTDASPEERQKAAP